MLRLTALCAAFVLSVAGSLLAQTTTATVTGRVVDASKATIPGAKVTIFNVATNISHQDKTKETGTYEITDLPVGTYRLEVEKDGFKTVIKPDIVLHVQDVVQVNFEMALGSVLETVNVEGGVPDVQLLTSSIGYVVNSATVRELPLNGRSWTDLTMLQPGVSVIETQPTLGAGANRGNRGFGNEVSISGSRPQDNNYRLDGISLNDYANGGPGSVLGGNLGVDAIQEYSVLTSSPSAEYGKTAGGVINAVTRSGTNNFHGNGYEFIRNSALDARNFFDGPEIPAFKRNQFGGSAGGPIIKSRTFIFGDYEGVRQSEGITSTSTVPSPAARSGQLSTGTVTVDPAAAQYLGLFPLPNRSLIAPGDVGIFSFAGQQVLDENFLTTRIDHTIADKDSASLTYMYDKSAISGPDALNDLLSGSSAKRQLAALEESHAFSPSFINIVRLGYNYDYVKNNDTVSAINPLAADPSLGAVPGRTASQLSVAGLTPTSGGLGALSTFLYAWTSFQASDDASLMRGNHSLKFGVTGERMQLNMLASSQPNGTWSFSSLAAFLTNEPSRFTSALDNAVTPRDLRQTLFGAYLQDDWQATKHLTLNLGLRYEMTTVPTELENKLVTLVNITDATPHLGNPLFQNPTLRNFEPRVGFAWDPFGNGKTAVRGASGLFDVLPLLYQFTDLESRAAPYYKQGQVSSLPQGSFYSSGYSLLGPSTLRSSYIQPDPKRSYVLQWNLDVQRELASNLFATVGYVGSHGVHQPFRVDDMDIVIPTATTAGYIFPSPMGSGTKINPAFGTIGGLFYEGVSSYNALQAGIQKRMSRGIKIQSSFTWGKSIDDNTSVGMGNQYGNSVQSVWNWFNPRASRGVSDFNIGRTLVLNGIWDVPGSRRGPEFAKWITSGWELGAIYSLHDGVPFTATFGSNGDPLGLRNNSPWDVPNRLTGSGCSSLVNPGNAVDYIKTQCFTLPTAPSQAFYNSNCAPSFAFPTCINLKGDAGRNILTGPGLSNLDFSVFKNIPFGEAFRMQFRAEFFNILNRTNFAVPAATSNTDVFEANGTANPAVGLLTSTVTTSRQIQFGTKLIW